MIKQLISDEKFANIQKAQSGLTKLFLKAKESGSFYRILKNDQPLGVLLPDNLWQSLVEDLEALSSLNFRKRIAKARKEKGTVKPEEIKKQLGL